MRLLTNLYRPLSLALLLCISPLARAEDPVGIRFFTGTWQGLLAEAKKQNKPIFVDVYTTWCGPCKLMAKEAFPDKAVGELFNANFVSYQIDAEKGEGLAVAKQYNVTAYPTSLFVSADGNLIQRTVGYGGIKGLLDEAGKAVEAAKDPKSVAVWDKEFADGKRDADFLKSYLAKRGTLGMPNPEALDAFLSVVPESEWTSPAHIDAVAANLTTADSKAFDPLLQAAKAMRMDRSRRQSISKVMQAVNMAVMQDQRKAQTEADMTRAVANMMKLRTAFSPKPLTAQQQASMEDDAWMSFYQRTKNVPKYRELAVKSGDALMAISLDSLKAQNAAAYQQFQEQTKLMPDSIKATPNFSRMAEMMKTGATQQTASKLNNLAWAFFNNMTDPADLKQALTWSGRSLELDRSAAFLDTYAQLLGKLGRKDEAIKHEEEALTKAKASGQDTANFEKTLVALKQKP